MQKSEVHLPDALYQKVEGLALKLHLTVPDLLRTAAEEMVNRLSTSAPHDQRSWNFPEGIHLGPIRAPVDEWRLLANSAID